MVHGTYIVHHLFLLLVSGPQAWPQLRKSRGVSQTVCYHTPPRSLPLVISLGAPPPVDLPGRCHRSENCLTVALAPPLFAWYVQYKLLGYPPRLLLLVQGWGPMCVGPSSLCHVLHDTVQSQGGYDFPTVVYRLSSCLFLSPAPASLPPETCLSVLCCLRSLRLKPPEMPSRARRVHASGLRRTEDMSSFSSFSPKIDSASCHTLSVAAAPVLCSLRFSNANLDYVCLHGLAAVLIITLFIVPPRQRRLDPQPASPVTITTNNCVIITETSGSLWAAACRTFGHKEPLWTLSSSFLDTGPHTW